MGRHDGHPIVTVTAPWSMADRDPTAPSRGYLAMLIGGLRESHNLDDAAIIEYLEAAPGCSDELVATALALPSMQR